MTEKKNAKGLKKYILGLILPVIVGVLMLDAVYLLPTERVEKNAVAAFEYFYRRAFDEENIEFDTLDQRDDFTDIIIFSNCFARLPGDPFYKAALRSTYIGYPVGTNETAQTEHYTKTDYPAQLYHPFYGMMYYVFQGSGFSYAEYSRYWGGYQTVLIPLFEIMSYRSLILLNHIVIVLLCAAAVILTAKRFGLPCCAAYACMLISLAPAVIPVCLQYSTMLYITLVSSILFYCMKNRENIPLLFMLTGSATAYFDFLTYPVLAPAVLCTLYILDMFDSETVPTIIKRLFVCCVLWAAGYSVMFGSKWVISAVVLGEGVFKEALLTAQFRISGVGYSLPEVLSYFAKTLALTARPPVIVISLLCAAVSVLFAVRKKDAVFSGGKLLLFLIPPMIVLAWFIVIRNHSMQHPFLVVRNCGAVWFALLALISSIKTKKIGSVTDAGDTKKE